MSSSLVWNSPRPLDKKTRDAFIQGKPQSEVKYLQIPVRGGTFLNSVYFLFILGFSSFLLTFVNILLQVEANPV